MKKIYLHIILNINALLWIILSTMNYIEIYRQIKTELMGAILWSVLIFMMYVLILYSGSLVITRIYYICRYRRIKTKYMNKSALVKQIVLLTLVIGYIYGLCYYNANFMGIIPMLLFFNNKLMQTGKFFVYHKERLIFMDDKSSEYIVKSINSLENSIVVQDVKRNNDITVLLKREKRRKEAEFLNLYDANFNHSQEVA